MKTITANRYHRPAKPGPATSNAWCKCPPEFAAPKASGQPGPTDIYQGAIGHTPPLVSNKSRCLPLRVHGPLWKKAPADVLVVRNIRGQGDWVEKWRSPTTGKWVYNYTLKFVQARARQKFSAVYSFGGTLGAIRAQVQQDLKKSGTKEQQLALVVALMDRGFFRVGNERSDDRGVYGVTTLESRHLKIDGHRAVFDYLGKKKVQQHRVVKNSQLSQLLAELKAGKHCDKDRLFVWGEDRIDAADVNDYLKPFGVTAKQFRTYHATRLVLEGLLSHKCAALIDRPLVVHHVVTRVAKQLGHSPKVCLKSYIDPEVVDAYLDGSLS